VANEVVAAHDRYLKANGRTLDNLSREQFFATLDVLTDLLFAIARSANPRTLSTCLRWSPATIYRRRQRGKMLLEQIDRIENELKHKAATDDVRWAKLFRRFSGLIEEAELDENSDNEQTA
jgi:hypothetical protein